MKIIKVKRSAFSYTIPEDEVVLYDLRELLKSPDITEFLMTYPKLSGVMSMLGNLCRKGNFKAFVYLVNYKLPKFIQDHYSRFIREKDLSEILFYLDGGIEDKETTERVRSKVRGTQGIYIQAYDNKLELPGGFITNQVYIDINPLSPKKSGGSTKSVYKGKISLHGQGINKPSVGIEVPIDIDNIKSLI